MSYESSKTVALSFNGQDIVHLATINTQDFDDTVWFTNTMRSVVDIYTGATVYSEQVFEQGKVPSLISLGIYREYLLPNSVLRIQTRAQSSDTSFANCIASLNVMKTTSQRLSDTSKTCISNNITSYSFNESAYYSFWIKTSVPLNYTITGEAYRYNVSNATLQCSLPHGYRCTFKSEHLRALKINPVHIYGVGYSPRHTNGLNYNIRHTNKIIYYISKIKDYFNIFSIVQFIFVCFVFIIVVCKLVYED